jgi:hypothetical protein
MDDGRDWKAEAEELRRVVDDLRSRLLALSRVLPVEYASVLEKGARDIESAAPGWDLYEGWRDSIDLTASDVETELTLLWERLGSKDRS